MHPTATRRAGVTGLLLADVVSTAGSEMTAIALPWLILVTTGSPAQMGAVLAAEFAGLTLLGLVGGRVASAIGSRPMMLTSDLARAALIAVIPVLAWLHALTFVAVLLITFVVGSFFPGYGAAQRVCLADLVHDDEVRLTRVSGLLGAVNETASFVGPALGGTLVVLLGAANVLFVDSATFLAAFLIVLVLVRPARPHPPRAASRPDTTATTEPVRAESAALGASPPTGEESIRAGLRYLVGHRQLRQTVIGLGVVGIGFAAVTATLPVLALRSGGGSSAAGWLLGAYGGGSVLGGLAAARARSTSTRGQFVAIVGIAVSWWLLPLLVGVGLPLWTVALAVGANGVCGGLYYPRFFAGLTTGTPAALRARVMTTVMIAISAPGPVGFLAAGLLNQFSASVLPALSLIAVCGTAGAVVILTAATTDREPVPASGTPAPA